MTSARDHRRRTGWILLGGFAAIGLISGLVAAEVLGVPEPRRWGIVGGNLGYWTLWGCLGVGVLALGRRLPLTGNRFKLAILTHAVCSVAFALVHIALSSASLMLLRGWIFGTPVSFSAWAADRQGLTRGQIEWEITMYWALVGLAHAVVFREEGRQRALLAAKLDAELSRTRLQALQQQMHPHFLFNTLQSITALMHLDVDAAERMVERLGALLRGSLRSDVLQLVTLAKELEYVEHYLAIEQLNMGSRLTVRIDIPHEVRSCEVPELLLQPLVENAVRHGIAPAKRGGTVVLQARAGAPWLELTVSDNGVGMRSSSTGTGIAIENTRRRLELLYPGQHAFSISSASDDSGVVAKIRIPIRRMGPLEAERNILTAARAGSP